MFFIPCECSVYSFLLSLQQEDRKDFGMTLADATRGSHSCLSRSYHLLGYCMVGNKKAMTKLLSAWLSEESDAIITKEVVCFSFHVMF